MGTTPDVRRFRANPIELVIFLAVTGVFINSAYRLFYQRESIEPALLGQQMASNAQALPQQGGRSPASAAPSFLNIDVKCENPISQDTQASKVRITGPLCGAQSADEAGKLIKTVVTNGSNSFSATVFTDLSASKFSTDYIPLNVGKNSIHLEFQYRGGRSVTQEVTVNKN